MASQAQSWANACTTSEVTPTGSGYGMSVVFDVSTTYNPSKGVSDAWYNDELQQFPAYSVADLPVSGPNSNFQSWGHFSQLVWPTTTQIGCGVSTTCSGTGFSTHYGCYYHPPGNFPGEFNMVNPPDGAPIVRANGES